MIGEKIAQHCSFAWCSGTGKPSKLLLFVAGLCQQARQCYRHLCLGGMLQDHPITQCCLYWRCIWSKTIRLPLSVKGATSWTSPWAWQDRLIEIQTPKKVMTLTYVFSWDFLFRAGSWAVAGKEMLREDWHLFVRSFLSQRAGISRWLSIHDNAFQAFPGNSLILLQVACQLWRFCLMLMISLQVWGAPVGTGGDVPHGRETTERANEGC